MQRLASAIIAGFLGILLLGVFSDPLVLVVSAKKGGGGGGGDGGSRIALQRASFGDPSAYPGVQTDGVMPCAPSSGPQAQYWNTVDTPDPECPAAASVGNVIVGLTGPEGIVFRPHKGEVNLLNPAPAGNRHFVLQYSSDPGDPPCPDLDATLYGAADEVFDGYLPAPDPDPCVDNVEALFRAGTEVFDLPTESDIFGANITVRAPQHNARGKKSTLAWPPVATLTYVSPFIVTDAGIDDDIVTITCGGTGVCTVSLTIDGVEIGEYNMPTQLTYQRVFCDDSDCISAP